MWFSYFFAALIGLCIGSFLNAVIYRLPRILIQTWRQECQTLLAIEPQHSSEKLSLWWPGSHCTHCQKRLRWYHNIPIMSFLWLKGKCAFCQKNIAWHYPLVELASLVITVFLAWRFQIQTGITPQFILMCLLSWLLIVLIVIDFQHQLLPDSLTQLILWLGLLASTRSLFVTPSDAIIGATLGYVGLWTVANIYQCITHREGMGHGDFKLLAALGAWSGWQGLNWIILIAALLGSAVGLSLLLLKRANAKTPIAFGPYLAIAGWVVLVASSINHSF